MPCLDARPLAATSSAADPIKSVQPPDGHEPADRDTDDSTAEFVLSEVLVVTATAREESLFELPYLAYALNDHELSTRRMTRTVPESLREQPGFMVQKTAHGQGSPYVRGFTGFRTLFLVDGIRLNTSVMRDGPNQYWATVDTLGLERLEAVRGPVSVLYGSDAVGGTVQAVTRRPAITTAGNDFGGRLYYRAAGAERSHARHLELAGALGTRLAYALSASLKDFGDLEAGGETGRQPHTGYGEHDFDLKLHFDLTGATELVAAYQLVSIEDAWRTHKTRFGRSWRGTSVGDEQRRVLDQRRSLAYVQLRHQGPGPIFDSLTASLSFHRQEEERDRVRRDGRRDLQGFDVDTWGAWLRLEKRTRFGHWTWGLESYRDGVDSFRLDFDPAGKLTRRAIQGPVADDATYRLHGVYVQNQLTLGQRLRIDLGMRTTRAEADAKAVEDPVTGQRIAVAGAWDQTVASARFLLPVGGKDHWHLFGGLSQAFRAPNLSDLTRLDGARSNEIETPTPKLAPETFLSWELGVKYRTPRVSFELAAFHTEIDDLIIRVPTGRIIDGDFEVTKRNSGRGFSRGFELAADARLSERFSAFGSLSWIDGEVDTPQLIGASAAPPSAASPRVREPLSRLMPTTVHLGVRWQGRQSWGEALMTLAEDADRLSSRDRADTPRIPIGGTPRYQVVTLRAGWDMGERWTLAAAIENVFDEDYRIHGSGLNEPGRNYVASLELRF